MNRDPDLLAGRVVIAAAWADGRLDEDEREALEDLLFATPDLTPETWRALRAEVDRPFGAEHREALIEDLRAGLADPADRSRARATLEAFVDRLPDDSPEVAMLRAALESLGAEEDAPESGWLSRLGEGLGGGLRRHASRLAHGRQQEQGLEERLAERIHRHWPSSQEPPSTDELQRLCLGAAILAYVVRLDGVVESGEREALRDALVDQWKIDSVAAALVAELALDEAAGGVDLHPLMRRFQNATTENDRQRFLAAVFQVAAGDGRASYDEIEEVRRIGRGLLLSHQHFIAAKLSVPEKRRET